MSVQNVTDHAPDATPAIDPTEVEAFAGRALGDLAGFMTTLMAGIGDRHGLFTDLATHGPATSGALAERTGTQERLLREWLGAMASAGYISYDPTSQHFALPAAHVPVLAQEGGPAFLGGFHQMLLGGLPIVEPVIEAFRQGGGVPLSAYPEAYWDNAARLTASWIENLLVPAWLPLVPDVYAKLQQGCRVADIGFGRGRALITLAKAFPESRFVGYDVHGPNVDAATTRARAEGVADRVSFRQLDATEGLPATYDLVLTFDVLHDIPDPVHLLRVIRETLAPDGSYLCLEFNSADTLEGNLGPVGVLLYTSSVIYCVSTALARGGESLGAAGLPESKLRELATEASFSSVRLVPIQNPLNALYDLRP
jgi:SAM-dependent methyltransferase